MKTQKGFTLLELMLVLVLIGYLATLVPFPSLQPDPFDATEKEAQVLQALINLASEHAVLNNIEMGLAVSEDSYAFLMFDGEKWQKLDEAPFVGKTLEPEFRFELILDGLDWQEENLLSAVELIDEEKLEEAASLPEEERLAAFPQVFLLSSGELSPFDLRVIYDNGFDDSVEFLVRGEFSTPVSLYDPQQQLEMTF